MMSAAWPSFTAAWNSPSAATIFARRSRSASASFAIARCILSGSTRPNELDGVVGVVRHLEVDRTVDHVAQRERPRGAVAARIRELARRQLGREHALQFGLYRRDALVLPHRASLGPPRAPIRKAEHHVDCNQQPQVARRR